MVYSVKLLFQSWKSKQIGLFWLWTAPKNQRKNIDLRTMYPYNKYVRRIKVLRLRPLTNVARDCRPKAFSLKQFIREVLAGTSFCFVLANSCSHSFRILSIALKRRKYSTFTVLLNLIDYKSFDGWACWALKSLSLWNNRLLKIYSLLIL